MLIQMPRSLSLFLSAAVSCLVLAAASPAQADEPVLPRSGDELADLIEECLSDVLATPDNTERYRHCFSFQAGVLAGATSHARLLQLPAPFCLTESAGDRLIGRRILAFIEAYPESRSWGAAMTTLGAIMKTYPCQGKKGSNK